jgi:type IV secretion system protein VirD4
MAAAVRAYTEAPDKTRASILTTMRNMVGFMASPTAQRGLNGGWGLLNDIRERKPMTIYLRVPPHMLMGHSRILRLWIATILTTVAERTIRPAIPDLFLVDEAATLGRLDEILTASSLLRGYGLRTWTFWQSISQIEGIYGSRAGEILDNAGTLSMFGASNAASARSLENLTGYGGSILGMPRGEQILCRQGLEPVRALKLDYRTDPAYHGLFDPNPFHGRVRSASPSIKVAA